MTYSVTSQHPLMSGCALLSPFLVFNLLETMETSQAIFCDLPTPTDVWLCIAESFSGIQLTWDNGDKPGHFLWPPNTHWCQETPGCSGTGTSSLDTSHRSSKSCWSWGSAGAPARLKHPVPVVKSALSLPSNFLYSKTTSEIVASFRTKSLFLLPASEQKGELEFENIILQGLV